MKVGLRAQFFHPRTMGVMHWGTVVALSKHSDKVKVKFVIDGKAYWTYPNYN